MIAARIKFPFIPFLLLVIAGCVYVPPYDDRPGYAYDYYYYPQVGVYFHLFSGDYYFRDGRHWVHKRVLPSRFYLDYRDRRPLVIRDETPYRYHDQHHQQHRESYRYEYNAAHDRDERRHNEEIYERYRNRSR